MNTAPIAFPWQDNDLEYSPMAIWASTNANMTTDQAADQINNAFIQLNDTKSINGRPLTDFWSTNTFQFENAGYAHQQFYTNCYSNPDSSYRTFFAYGHPNARIRTNATKQLQAKLIFNKFAPILGQNYSNIINPLVSTSKQLPHALKYASGEDKKYPYGTQFRPIYDARGRLPNDEEFVEMGRLITYTMTAGDYLGSVHYDVQELNTLGKICIRARVIHEAEVSFPGKVPQSVVNCHALKLPSFHDDWHEEMELEYGILNKDEYNTFKRIMLTNNVAAPIYERTVKVLLKRAANKVEELFNHEE